MPAPIGARLNKEWSIGATHASIAEREIGSACELYFEAGFFGFSTFLPQSRSIFLSLSPSRGAFLEAFVKRGRVWRLLSGFAARDTGRSGAPPGGNKTACQELG